MKSKNEKLTLEDLSLIREAFEDGKELSAIILLCDLQEKDDNYNEKTKEIYLKWLKIADKKLGVDVDYNNYNEVSNEDLKRGSDLLKHYYSMNKEN